ncbi:MAG: sigma-70 family RNA polymerase sigma factor [Planctomycetes bacterium]|nr:sigma-70 family RNA polymerase sigma factor [Planctomycetota bacterium]
MPDVTRILSQIESGDPEAAAELLPLVYDELRKLAAAKLKQESPGQTLQATALVHEAYLRLMAASDTKIDDDPTHWDGRGHFFAAAAEAMRRILVDSARRKKQTKRGGELARQELTDSVIASPVIREDLVALDAALDRLKVVDPQALELVHLRYFAGFSNPEAAAALGISARTADRLWAFARAWLRCEMAETAEDDKKP